MLVLSKPTYQRKDFHSSLFDSAVNSFPSNPEQCLLAVESVVLYQGGRWSWNWRRRCFLFGFAITPVFLKSSAFDSLSASADMLLILGYLKDSFHKVMPIALDNQTIECNHSVCLCFKDDVESLQCVFGRFDHKVCHCKEADCLTKSLSTMLQVELI